MALTGELTDLSLAELIEFFCNQRKTGRLKVVYPTGPGYFYLQSGAVVHARVGELRGIEAVYYALTQRNAQFTFSPAFEAPEHSINQPWTSVVLEGLRRMDEGISPPNPFPEGAVPLVEEPVVASAEEVKGEVKEARPVKEVKEAAPKIAVPPAEPEKEVVRKVRPAPEVPARAVPVLSQIDASSRFGSARWKLGAAVAAVVLVVAVISVPWGWYARSKAAKANEAKNVMTAEQPPANVPAAPSETSSPQAATEVAQPAANSEAADIARRQHEARQKDETRKKNDAAQSSAAAASKPQPLSSSGSKKVTVQVTYDENGRVTQASGGDPTALRIARQKRFPAGKAGSATVTIPIN